MVTSKNKYKQNTNEVKIVENIYIKDRSKNTDVIAKYYPDSSQVSGYPEAGNISSKKGSKRKSGVVLCVRQMLLSCRCWEK